MSSRRPYGGKTVDDETTVVALDVGVNPRAAQRAGTRNPRRLERFRVG